MSLYYAVLASTLSNMIQKPWIAGSEIILSDVLVDNPLGEVIHYDLGALI